MTLSRLRPLQGLNAHARMLGSRMRERVSVTGLLSAALRRACMSQQLGTSSLAVVERTGLTLSATEKPRVTSWAMPGVILCSILT